MRRTIWWLPFVAMGCATTISPTGRVGQSPGARGELEGLPVQLTSPAFLITEKPADTGPTSYTLAVINRADPAHRYLVGVKPEQLSTTDFTLAFGAQSQLTSLGTTQTPAAATLIKPIGEFVAGAVSIIAKVAGAFAVAAADTATKAERGFAGFLEDGAACPKPDEYDAAVKAFSGPKPTLDAMQAAVKQGDWDALAAVKCGKCAALLVAAEDQLRCNALASVKSRFRADLDDAQNGALLYPQTSAERALFGAAAQKAKVFEPKAYTDALVPVNAAQRQAIVRAVEEGNLGAVRAVTCSGCDDLKKLATMVIKQRLLAKPLEAATKLSSNDWRHRHATWLETGIDRVEQSLALGPSADEARRLRDRREELRDQLATTIGASSELARIRVLQAVLERRPEDVVPKLSKASNAAGMSEFEIARKELDDALTVMAAKRQALRPAGVPAPPKPVERTFAVSASWLKEGRADEAWAKAEADKAGNKPDFLVTVEEGTNP